MIFWSAAGLFAIVAVQFYMVQTLIRENIELQGRVDYLLSENSSHLQDIRTLRALAMNQHKEILKLRGVPG